MLVFRSLTIGLLIACVVLLAQLGRPAPIPEPRVDGVRIVDVARGVSAAMLAEILHLAPDEHVVAVDGNEVRSDLAAGAAIAAWSPAAGRYLDLTVASPAGLRRMLVLVH